MTTGMIIIAVVAVIIAFAACANAAGTNATNVATSAEKSSKIGKQIGKEYYDSIPTGGTELEEFMAIGRTFIMPAVYRRVLSNRNMVDYADPFAPPRSSCAKRHPAYFVRDSTQTLNLPMCREQGFGIMCA